MGGETSGGEPRASVVVPVRNAAGFIPYQLEALRVQASRNDLEVLVVDDASTDDTAAVVADWIAGEGSGRFRLLRRTERGGPNSARNTAAAAATSDVLLFCDGDDIVDAGWSDAVLGAYDEGVVLFGMQRAMAPDPPQIEWFRPRKPGPQQVAGGNMAVSRSIVKRVGGFDENILTGGSEFDFVLRAVRDAGAELRAVPTAVVDYRTPTSAWARLTWQFRKQRGHTYLRRKFSGDVFGSRLRSLAATWARLLAVAPRTFFDSAARLYAADQLGRLIGRGFWSLVPRRLLVNPASRRRP